MAKTVADLLKRIGVHVNGEAEAPSSGSDEEALWIECLDNAQDDWVSAHDWEVLRKTYNTTLAQSGTSLGLPSDFIKLDGYPLIDGNEYEEIRPEEESLFDDENYVVVGGNEAEGYYLGIHSAPTSNVSVSVRYFSRPTALTTTTFISPCPNPNFLVASAAAKILKNRGDSKFTLFEQEANLLLARMLESETTKLDQFDNSVRDHLSKMGYRPGED